MSDIKEIRRNAVKITLSDGKERELRFSLNAFALLEEKYGNIEVAMEAMETGSIKAIRYMLWAGFVDSDPDLTELQVGNLIDIKQLPELTAQLTVVIDMDTPDTDQGTVTDPN